jgi:hypothetical protein
LKLIPALSIAINSDLPAICDVKKITAIKIKKGPNNEPMYGMKYK